MTHLARRFVYALLCAILLLPTAGRSQTKNDLATEFRDRWMFAVKEGDAAKFASLFAENATVMPPGFPTITGRKAIENFYRDGFILLSVGAIEVHPKEHQVDSGSVREHGVYKITFVPKDDEELSYSVSGRYLFIANQRPDGKWEIVWAMHTIENKVPLDQL